MGTKYSTTGLDSNATTRTCPNGTEKVKGEGMEGASRQSGLGCGQVLQQSWTLEGVDINTSDCVDLSEQGWWTGWEEGNGFGEFWGAQG